MVNRPDQLNMYSKAEYEALTKPLSNDARVLYCLGLRPFADPATASTPPINYKSMIALLNGGKDTYSRGREINELLRELEQKDLISLSSETDFDQSLNGVAVFLPLMLDTHNQFETLHQSHNAMTMRWQPDESLFIELSQLLGIIDGEYSKEELGEFIAYWLGRPITQYTQFQWTQKFAQHIKRQRTAIGMTPQKQVGTQVVSPTASIEVDENARKLVEKYASKQRKK